MPKSNLGRELKDVLKDVSSETIDRMAQVIRQSLSTHPSNCTCSCAAIEALAVLYSRGYVVTNSGEFDEEEAERLSHL